MKIAVSEDIPTTSTNSKPSPKEDKSLNYYEDNVFGDGVGSVRMDNDPDPWAKYLAKKDTDVPKSSGSGEREEGKLSEGEVEEEGECPAVGDMHVSEVVTGQQKFLREVRESHEQTVKDGDALLDLAMREELQEELEQQAAGGERDVEEQEGQAGDEQEEGEGQLVEEGPAGQLVDEELDYGPAEETYYNRNDAGDHHMALHHGSSEVLTSEPHHEDEDAVIRAGNGPNNLPAAVWLLFGYGWWGSGGAARRWGWDEGPAEED